MSLFLSFLDYHISLIDKELKNQFEQFKKNLPTKDKTIIDMIKNLEEFSLRGGKRVRPALLLLGYFIFKDKVDKKIYTLAGSLELIHAFLLIHDDVMDKTKLRRGKDTLHIIYTKHKIRKDYDKDTYGNNMAIVAGDLLCSFCYKQILTCKLDPETKLKVMSLTNDVIINTCIGQALDMRVQGQNKVKEHNIIEMYALKTARYSIEGPLITGATIGNAHIEHIKSLSAFSIPLGIAFQLQDDLLDIFQSKKQTGKDNYSDLREGKRTLLLMKTLSLCTKEQKQFILSNIGENLTDKDAERIKEIIVSTGAKEEIDMQIESYINQSEHALDKSTLSPLQKKYLFDLAQFILKRKK
jgi:geranylgeranyl diphosphate synthase, type I